MSKDLVMPERKPTDGSVVVRRSEDDGVEIEVTTDGQVQFLKCSRYNAFRLFGILSVMLEIPLSSKVGKAIKL